MPKPPPALPDQTQLRDELERQFRLLRAEMPVRLVATALAYAMGLLFLPAPFVIAVALIDLIGEIVTHRLFLDIDAMLRERWRRRLAVAAVFVIETCFALPAAVMWHLDDPYAKSLAVGLAAGSMMHLATVRSIHLPMAIAGASALAILLVGSNTVFWLGEDGWHGLAVSTACVVVALGYFVEAMLSTHALHRDTAAGRRAAMEANAAKDRLLATISHELRTPLNGIVGMAHAERQHANNPGAVERLDVLVACADGLTTLLDDILDLSAAREGRLPIRPAAASAAEEIARTAGLFAPAMAQQGVDLALSVSPELDAPALFDAQRLRQCLSNLLSNALKHGRGSPIRVTARRECPASGDPMLEVIVEDDGPGIPAAEAARAFEPFGQLAPGPAGAGHSHGLGLSITRMLARQMGGDVVLEPGPGGRGAAFRLRIRLLPAPPTAAAPDGLGALPRLDGLKVLIVDDVATNRMVAASYLRLAGAVPVEAADGAAAVARLGGDAVDAVLLDLHMPGLDGLATLAALRALPGAAGRVPVIAMTADAGPDRRAELVAAGIDGFLPKPVPPERMLAEITRVLDAPAARNGPDAALPLRPSGARWQSDAPPSRNQPDPPALTGTDP